MKDRNAGEQKNDNVEKDSNEIYKKSEKEYLAGDKVNIKERELRRPASERSVLVTYKTVSEERNQQVLQDLLIRREKLLEGEA